MRLGRRPVRAVAGAVEQHDQRHALPGRRAGRSGGALPADAGPMEPPWTVKSSAMASTTRLSTSPKPATSVPRVAHPRACPAPRTPASNRRSAACRRVAPPRHQPLDRSAPPIACAAARRRSSSASAGAPTRRHCLPSPDPSHPGDIRTDRSNPRSGSPCVPRAYPERNPAPFWDHPRRRCLRRVPRTTWSRRGRTPRYGSGQGHAGEWTATYPGGGESTSLENGGHDPGRVVEDVVLQITATVNPAVERLMSTLVRLARSVGGVERRAVDLEARGRSSVSVDSPDGLWAAEPTLPDEPCTPRPRGSSRSAARAEIRWGSFQEVRSASDRMSPRCGTPSLLDLLDHLVQAGPGDHPLRLASSSR